MATTFIKDAVKVFIARENTISDSHAGNYVAQDGSALVEQAVIKLAGASIDEMFLYEIEHVTGVSIGSFGKEFDTYQNLGDAFDHDIDIKETGSGSCDFIIKEDTTTTNWDHLMLKALAYYFPNGWNEIDDGDANTPRFNPTRDVQTTRATDSRGYAIIVQQQISSSSYLFWCFDNCKINCSISFASRQASRGTLSWEDARYVSFDTHSAAISSGTDDHNDGYAKGWHTASTAAKPDTA